MSINTTTISGNVGRDPELRYTPAGVAVSDFSVAVNEYWTDRTSGQRQSKTTWFRCTAWRGLAETVNQYVKKGQHVTVTGKVEASAYLGSDGQPRASLDLTIQNIDFGNNRAEQDGDVPSQPDPEDLPF